MLQLLFRYASKAFLCLFHRLVGWFEAEGLLEDVHRGLPESNLEQDDAESVDVVHLAKGFAGRTLAFRVAVDVAFWGHVFGEASIIIYQTSLAYDNST